MLWHIKIRYLPNAVSQSPRPPVSKAKTHTKAETGKQSENSASPNSRVLHKRWLFRCQNVSPLKFDYFIKSRVCLAFPKANTRSLHSPTGSVGMTGFGTLKALSYQKPQAKAPERRFHWRKNIPRRKPANYPQNSASPNSGVLCLCKEKRSFFDKPRLQRLPKRLSLKV